MLVDKFVIGVVIGAHGVRGKVRIKPLTDDPERFMNLTNCFLQDSGKLIKEVEVSNPQIHGNTVLLDLAGLHSREEAEALRGVELAVRRSDAIPLEANSWYISDLIGCEVYDEVYGYLGKVKDVLQQSHHDNYVVSLPGAKDLLFPALKSVLQKVDVKVERIDINLPNGLYEIYRSGDKI